jgi:hypothetical protein
MKIIRNVLIIFSVFYLLTAEVFSQINESTDEGWRILDETSCMQIIKSFKSYFTANDISKVNSIGFSDKIIIYQEIGEIGADKNIKGLQIGEQKFEPNDFVRKILGDNLFNFIKDRSNYAYEIYSTPTLVKRDICHLKADNTIWWLPLDKNSILIQGPWDLHLIALVDERWYGFEIKTGIDELNLPSIFSGTARVGIVTEKFRIGAQIPLGFGKSGFIGSRSRLLESGIGGYLNFNQEVNNRVQVFGGLFYSDLASKVYGEDWNIIDKDSVCFLRFGGNIGLSFNSDILRPAGMSLKFSVGGEYHQIGEAQILDSKNINEKRRMSFGSPFVRLDVYECDNNICHFFIQYTNTSLMFGGWYNISRDWNLDLGLNAVLVSPLRDAEKWEQPSLIIPQIRLRF